jgi:hypothetical protein
LTQGFIGNPDGFDNAIDYTGIQSIFRNLAEDGFSGTIHGTGFSDDDDDGGFVLTLDTGSDTSETGPTFRIILNSDGTIGLVSADGSLSANLDYYAIIGGGSVAELQAVLSSGEAGEAGDNQYTLPVIIGTSPESLVRKLINNLEEGVSTDVGIKGGNTVWKLNSAADGDSQQIVIERADGETRTFNKGDTDVLDQISAFLSLGE